jgi:hypothetical protein
MILNLHATVRRPRLDLLKALLEAGDPATGLLRIYSGTMASGVLVAPSGTLLLEFPIGLPAGTVSANSTSASFTFAPVVTAAALQNGTATWGRLLDYTGMALLDGDCTDIAGSGVFKLSSTLLVQGALVALVTGVLSD